MKIKFLPETVVSLILVLITFMLFRPMYLLMPESTHSWVLLFMVVVFIVFASLVWRERGRDEREIQHKYVAGRLAFLIGSAALVIGIVVQSLHDEVDIWLLIALLVMTLTKTIAQIVNQLKN